MMSPEWQTELDSKMAELKAACDGQVAVLQRQLEAKQAEVRHLSRAIVETFSAMLMCSSVEDEWFELAFNTLDAFFMHDIPNVDADNEETPHE